MPVLSKRQVYYSKDSKAHTRGGLYKRHLMVNKRNKVVSRKMHARGLEMFKKNNLQPKTAEQMKELRAMRRRK